jgi:adenosylmethionine-8-amino-7-oxononanoate aminotransferase
MKTKKEFPIVKRAKGSFIFLQDDKILIDAISSWWSTIHGYSHKELNQHLKKQINKFSHVMLGGLTHEPAIKLAEKLVEITPKGLNHVFYSDSGSVAVEVSLKMAIQYWSNQGKKEKTKILSLKKAYHGDTFKAMEISDDSDFVSSFSHVLQKGIFVESPTGGFDETNITENIKALEEIILNHQHQLAAFILEPIIQCAGGFKIYSPKYLELVRKLCNKYDVVLIFDEVATGFGRTGKLFATEHSKAIPDIMILGKALTAGYIGHAATITSSKIYSSFLSKKQEKAFMHGPTFMGNPLACAVALKSIEIFERDNYLQKIAKIQAIMEKDFAKIESKIIKEKRVLGAIGVIELKDKIDLYGFNEFSIENNVWIRPIGTIIYIMPAYTIKKKELKTIIKVIANWIKLKENNK